MTQRKYVEAFVTAAQVAYVLKRGAENYHFPEGKLWVEVILQAVRDMMVNSENLQEEAARFVCGSGFERACGLAGLDPEYARNVIAQLGTQIESEAGIAALKEISDRRKKAGSKYT